jgi:hypothetical protein
MLPSPLTVAEPSPVLIVPSFSTVPILMDPSFSSAGAGAGAGGGAAQFARKTSIESMIVVSRLGILS